LLLFTLIPLREHWEGRWTSFKRWWSCCACSKQWKGKLAFQREYLSGTFYQVTRDRWKPGRKSDFESVNCNVVGILVTTTWVLLWEQQPGWF
jgi:hypothetical protein